MSLRTGGGATLVWAGLLGITVVAAAALVGLVQYVRAPASLGTVHSSYVIADPELYALPVEQKLDRALSVPGIRGVIRGSTGHPTVRPISWGSQREIVTDFPFAIRAFHGRGVSPHPLGGTVTLRIAGGTYEGLTMTTINPPTVAAGQDLFVFVRDQGEILGGNTSDVLVATTPPDVLEVRNGAVYGQGQWSHFSEPVDKFIEHFNR